MFLIPGEAAERTAAVIADALKQASLIDGRTVFRTYAFPRLLVTAKVDDFGVAIDRNDEVDGYAVSFVTSNEDHSLAPMLAGLPEGRCWCPQWGYVFGVQITVTYADREEVFEAGDAFYMTPGYVPAATKGNEFLQISPAEAMKETITAIQAAMRRT